jgi:uncharacterized membrane protein (DUF106 family)
MSILNSLLRPLIDTLQAPLAGRSPLLGIVLWSIPTAWFALLVFKWASNQNRIAEVKRRIQACLFEIRLFNDDLRSIVRAQGEIFRHVVHYQGLALKPMIWILPPLILLMVHLHAFYGFRALQPGDEALVSVEIEDGWQSPGGSDDPPVSLDAPPGVRLDTPAVWVPSLNEVSWRVVAEAPGDYELRFAAGDQHVSKSLTVTDRVVRLSPTRPDRSFLGQLEWPSEPPIPRSAPIRAIHVAYPEGKVNIFGWTLDSQYAWMIVFFVLTMVIAVAVKGRMGVEL